MLHTRVNILFTLKNKPIYVPPAVVLHHLHPPWDRSVVHEREDSVRHDAGYSGAQVSKPPPVLDDPEEMC